MRFATMFNVTVEKIHPDARSYLMREGLSDAELHAMWAEKPWEQDDDMGYPCDYEDRKHAQEAADVQHDIEDESMIHARNHFPAEVQALIQPGEIVWALERNAAAGFYRVAEYLK